MTTGPIATKLTGPEALSNIFAPLNEALGVVVEQPDRLGPGDPSDVGVIDDTSDVYDVDREAPEPAPELTVRHIVEVSAKGAVDGRTFRVNIGPVPVIAGTTLAAASTTVLDANPRRNRALVRNVSVAAVSIFLVRVGQGGAGTYPNVGYRLQQNGETIELKNIAGWEAYCLAGTDLGLLQVIEEFGTNADGSIEAPA